MAKYGIEKTASNPKGGGRVKGKKYPHLSIYPGSQAQHRLDYCRMRAQAKYRNEQFDITWEEFQQLWEGKWHLRGRDRLSLCLTRKDWSGVWNLDNVELVTRIEHVRKQGLAKAGKPRAPYKPRADKNAS